MAKGDTTKWLLGMGAAFLASKVGPTLDGLRQRPKELVIWVDSLDEDSRKLLPPAILSEYHFWKGVGMMVDPTPMSPIEVKSKILPWMKTWRWDPPIPPAADDDSTKTAK